MRKCGEVLGEVWGRCHVSVGEVKEGVEKGVRGVRESVERCKVSVEKCGETCHVSVGERCWVSVGRSWDECGGCGQRCEGGVEECVDSPHASSHLRTFQHTFPHFPQSLDSSHTLFHISPILPYIPKTLPTPHPNTLP